MRPRVFPAEDKLQKEHIRSRVLRFNEAAGIPRGRRRPVLGTAAIARGFNEAAGIPRGRLEIGRELARVENRASMRPRVFPAEDFHN